MAKSLDNKKDFIPAPPKSGASKTMQGVPDPTTQEIYINPDIKNLFDSDKIDPSKFVPPDTEPSNEQPGGKVDPRIHPIKIVDPFENIPQEHMPSTPENKPTTLPDIKIPGSVIEQPSNEQPGGKVDPRIHPINIMGPSEIMPQEQPSDNQNGGLTPDASRLEISPDQMERIRRNFEVLGLNLGKNDDKSADESIEL